MAVFNSLDILEIQECLCSYKLVLKALTSEDEFDVQMKEARETSVDYLINKCEEALING